MELEDNYEHVINEIFYTTENVVTESLNDEQITQGCICERECKLETNCTCLKRSGAIYAIDGDFEDLDQYFIVETDVNKPIYECNNSCKCFESFCGNRLVQFGPRKHLQIIPTEEKGFGLTTTTRIKQGNFICEYAGEIISADEAKKRYESNKELGKMNYIFCINENFGEKNYKTFIDPSIFGNIGRYINHSCEPNCVLHPIRVNSTIPKLCIFAKTDIETETEITFNYGNQNSTFEDEVTNTTNRIDCLCKSKKCKKYLPYFPQLQ